MSLKNGHPGSWMYGNSFLIGVSVLEIYSIVVEKHHKSNGFWVPISNVCVCWGAFPHTNRQFSNTSWVSCNSTQLWHYLAKEDIIRPHTLSPTRLLPTLRFRCQSQVQIITCASALSPWAKDSKFKWPPFLGSINLLECLTKLRHILLTKSLVI